MKSILAVVLVAVAAAAPVEETKEAKPVPAVQAVPLLREKRSSYGAVYSPPCAAQVPLLPHLAPSYGLPGLASHGSYGYNPHAGYPPVGYGPHYRADDQMSEDGEMMSFSDMDHVSMARSYGYGAPAAQHGGYGAGGAGPAVGVFPNAHVSGCNVPLLLSCSPSVVPGRIVSHGGYGGGVSVVAAGAGAGAGGYRGADEHGHAPQDGPADDHREEHLQPHHEQRMPPQEAGHMPTMHS